MNDSPHTEHRTRLLNEFARYFIASLVALVCDAGSLALLTSVFNVPYLIAGACAFALGLTVIYLLSVRWVFGQRSLGSSMKEFMLFALVGVFGLGVNEIVLWLVTGVFGYFYLFGKAASVVVVFAWNFIARKTLLFS